MPNVRKSELEKSSFLCYTDSPNVNVGGPISVYNFKVSDDNPPVLSDGGFTYNEIKNGGFGYLHLIFDENPDEVIEYYVPLYMFERFIENDTVTYTVNFVAGDSWSFSFEADDPDEIMTQNLE